VATLRRDGIPRKLIAYVMERQIPDQARDDILITHFLPKKNFSEVSVK
jgi:hypothetical protein